MTRFPSRLALSVALTLTAALSVVACHPAPSGPPAGSVVFVLDAPFCGLKMPVEFSIDHALVGTDTFRIHTPPDHTESRLFPAQPGYHLLSARVNGSFVYVWRDTTMLVTSGAVARDTLGFYCS